MGHFILMISLDITTSSEVRIAGDRPKFGRYYLPNYPIISLIG